MQVIEVTNSNVFNVMFSLFVYLTAIIAPLFAALALSRN
jgi:hypothetical protein